MWLRLRTILDKEWAEVFKNRMVLLTVALMPVLFTALPLLGRRSVGTSISRAPDRYWLRSAPISHDRRVRAEALAVPDGPRTR